MKDTRLPAQALYHPRIRSIRDLYALAVLSIAGLGYAGEKGKIPGVCLAIGGILAVLLLATFADGGWFKKRNHRSHAPAGGKQPARVTGIAAARSPAPAKLPGRKT